MIPAVFGKRDFVAPVFLPNSSREQLGGSVAGQDSVHSIAKYDAALVSLVLPDSYLVPADFQRLDHKFHQRR